jgi:hypothetical protein
MQQGRHHRTAAEHEADAGRTQADCRIRNIDRTGSSIAIVPPPTTTAIAQVATAGTRRIVDNGSGSCSFDLDGISSEAMPSAMTIDKPAMKR